MVLSAGTSAVTSARNIARNLASDKKGLVGEFLMTHRFSVEVTGILTSTLLPITGYFTAVDGLEAQVEVLEYKTVTVFGELVTQKIPGPPRWGEITLKRGVTDGMGFWAWHEVVHKGGVEVARSSVTINLHDLEGNIYAQWQLDKAWPSKVSGPSLNAENGEVAIEELTIVHEGLSRLAVDGWSVLQILTGML